MVIKIKSGKSRIDEYAGVMKLGIEHHTILDKFCALMLAISPILQHYKGLYQNAGFTVLLFATPVLLLRLLAKHKASSRVMMALVPLLLFELYTVFIRSYSVSRLFYVLFIILIFFTVANGCVNTAHFLKYATGVVCIATGLLVFQYITHYIFHRTVNLRPFNLLVSQNVIWVRHSLTTYSASKLYRPAAFFLEPSHFFLYAFPVLGVLLLSPNITVYRKRVSIWITMGLLLTTSGFGIFAAIGLWGVYFLLYSGAERRQKVISRFVNTKAYLYIILFVIAMVLAYLFIPIFNRSVNRIFFATEGSSAIDGRIKLASNFILTITDEAVWFGQAGVVSELDFNLAGFFATFIKWGVIGVALSYWFYGQGLWKLKGCYFWITLIILVTSFFSAHTHGTFYMIYYGVFLMNGYYILPCAKKTTNKARKKFYE